MCQKFKIGIKNKPMDKSFIFDLKPDFCIHFVTFAIH